MAAGPRKVSAHAGAAGWRKSPRRYGGDGTLRRHLSARGGSALHVGWAQRSRVTSNVVERDRSSVPSLSPPPPASPPTSHVRATSRVTRTRHRWRVSRGPALRSPRQSPARWKTRGARPAADPPAAREAMWRRARRAARVRGVRRPAVWKLLLTALKRLACLLWEALAVSFARGVAHELRCSLIPHP